VAGGDPKLCAPAINCGGLAFSRNNDYSFINSLKRPQKKSVITCSETSQEDYIFEIIAFQGYTKVKRKRFQ